MSARIAAPLTLLLVGCGNPDGMPTDSTTSELEAQLGDLQAIVDTQARTLADLEARTGAIEAVAGFDLSVLDDYATHDWVDDQAYATESWTLTRGFATEGWTLARGYVDEGWVGSQG